LQGVGAIVERLYILGFDLEGAVIGLQCFCRALKRLQHAPAVVERFYGIRFDLKRTVIAFQRIGITLKILQSHTPVVEDIGMIGVNGECPIVAWVSFLVSFKWLDPCARSLEQILSGE